MDRKTRLQIEDGFERRGGLLVPTEYGEMLIPKNARILKGGGPQVKENWGEDVELRAGVAVLSRDGEVKSDVEFASKSFTRWFARVMQGVLDHQGCTLTDHQGTPFFVPMQLNQGVRLTPNLTEQTSAQFGQPGGQLNTGAALAIGNGALGGADSGQFTLKNLLFLQDAHADGIVTQDNAVAMAFYITTGITLATIGGTTIFEIGMFNRIKGSFGPTHYVLMAYDEVNPGVVAAYGDVIAPKYSMSFAA